MGASFIVRLFCVSTFLSIPCQLPPLLLASTRASYVKSIYTASSFFLAVSCFSNPDASVSDKDISVHTGELLWHTLTRWSAQRSALSSCDRQPDKSSKSKWHTCVSRSLWRYRQPANVLNCVFNEVSNKNEDTLILMHFATDSRN